MTDEEIEVQAEKYGYVEANKLLKFNENCHTHFTFSRADISKAFQDGAKWGMEHTIEWHDLRKNPNNLPKEDDKFLYKFEILVPIDNCNLTEFCIIDGNKYIAKIASWNKDFNIFFTLEGKNYLRNNVIAWCELPTYKE